MEKMTHETYNRENVVQIISMVLRRMSDSRALFGEILKAHIPKATEELKVIVSTTESTTNTIMEACENIQKALGAEKSPLSQKVEAEIGKIIEACTFQDITGQRISKITKTMQEIYDRLQELLHILDGRFSEIAKSKKAVPAAVPKEDKHLMNGPQLPGQGVTQEEIDRLLAELG